MTLFIETFMPGTVDTPSIATIDIPAWGGYPSDSFKALITADTTIQMGNRFGSLLPAADMISEISQVIGTPNIAAWIGASAQGWRGTEPIKFGLDMYLVNYKPGLNYEKSIQNLTRLATVMPAGSDSFTNGYIQVLVHGGYSPDVFAENRMQAGAVSKDQLSSGMDDGNAFEDDETRGAAMTMGSNIATGSANYEGTLTVKIGERFILDHLLLVSCSVTPSVVQVYSPTSGEKPKPLYYRVHTQFMTCRCAVHTDVEKMFRG